MLRLYDLFIVLFNDYILKNIRLINCKKAALAISAVAEHSWTNDHHNKWNEVSILATDSQKFSHKMEN